MKKLLLSFMLIGFAFALFAQVQRASTHCTIDKNFSSQSKGGEWAEAGMFTATDINGVEHDLEAYLNAGKTVILNFSTVWCGPCWNLHQSGTLQDLHETYGPGGTDELVALWIEAQGNPQSEIEGVGNTQGDWTNGGTYPVPIISDASVLNGFAELFEGGVPYIVMVCPTGLYKDIWDEMWTSAAAVYNAIGDCPDPGEPFALLSDNLWDAGTIEVDTDENSPDFTLTNGLGGTLTVSGVTSLSTPWSTDFVAGDVSLEEGQSYTFTFNFAPTEVGNYEESFEITTNAGTVTVDLSGSAYIPGSVMDGGFETNVNDFDMEFLGWIQYDFDESHTWGIDGTTFPNSNYTGSFIAFNPSQTDPPMTNDAIQPKSGDRFGACFAAVEPPNDDWLITPQSDPINPGAVLRFWVKSYTDQYGLDRYTVNISTTGTDVSDFTKISTGDYLEAPAEAWTLDEYPLDAYVGQQIYVGIQCVSDDSFIFMIDDIEIDNPVAIESEIKDNVQVYPNPSYGTLNINNAQGADVYVTNLTGQRLLNLENINDFESIDISHLSAGSYIVTIKHNNNITHQNIILIK